MMFRRTVIAQGFGSDILFDIADNAAGTNWYRMGSSHQIVNNNATVNTYKIRFKPSGGFPGADITPSIVPYFFYRMEGDPATPSGWNAVVDLLSNPENYTIVRTVCTHNSDGYWYGTLTLEQGVSYIFPCGNYLVANLKENYTFNFTGTHCTGTFQYRNAGGQPRTSFENGAKIPLAWQLIVSLTAEEGYSFTGATNVENDSPYFGLPTVSNLGAKMTVTYPIIWGEDVVPITAVDQWPTSATINVSATAELTQDGNIISAQTTGCSVTGIPQGGFIPAGESVTLTATAYSGNYFAAVPVARYIDLQGEEQIVRFSRNEDNTVATLTQVFSDIAQNGTAITIEATAVVIPPETWTVEVRTQVNCSVSAPTSYTENTTFTATATPADGYRFDTAPVLTDGTNNFNFTIGEDGTASYNGILTGLVEDVTLYIDATAVEIPKKTYPVVVSTVNCSVTGVPVGNVYTEGETLNLVMTANEGYYFDVPPQIKFYAPGSVEGHRDFTIDPANDARATFNGVLPELMDGRNVTIYAVAAAKTVYTDKYGSINVYNVTIDELTQFAEERFFTVEGESGTQQEVDLGDYVSKLFRLYCDIGETTESTLKVGNFNLSNINVQVPVNDTFTVDCGTLTVNGKNGTANDFNGELQIMLPFIGFQTINIDKALNNPLHLYYKINLVTGESVAILEINSIPTYYWDCKACQEILYLSHVQENFSDYEFKSKFLYGFVPFIVYKYNTDFNTSPVNSDAVREKVMNCVGYFEMTETTPFNAPNMNETERAKIIELLNSGVFYGAEFE
jgi:hypothetical protein